MLCTCAALIISLPFFLRPFLSSFLPSAGDPYSYCLGKRYAQKPSSFEPACVDHNMSLNTLSGCYSIDGIFSERCMQVGGGYDVLEWLLCCHTLRPLLMTPLHCPLATTHCIVHYNVPLHYSLFDHCMSHCTHPASLLRDVQVVYTQNAFIPLCGSAHSDDDHCGVFLEIHIRDGTPYSEENDIISEVKITTPQVSGYMTTNMNVTWQGDDTRVLCSYTEDFVRVGSIVYITPTAPICCCPGSYTLQARTGRAEED